MWWFRKREKIHFDYTHDIHSHVLPGVDDGVRTYGEAIMVLKGLSRLGVKRVTCTSHVYFPALMNGRENLHPLLEDLRAGLQKEGIEIELDLGAEYRVGEYMLSLIERGEILSGDEKRVLVEHNFLSPSPFFDQVVFELQTRGYEVVLAHPERYVFWADDIVRHGEELKNKNCRLQVNILSFAGYYGKEAQRGAERLYDAGLIDYYAGDVHGMRHVEAIGKYILNS